MDFEGLLAAWRAAGPGCALAHGSWREVQAAEARLRAAGVPVARLNAELLARIEEPEELAARAVQPVTTRGGRTVLAEPEPARQTVREALQAALTDWVASLAQDSGPLAIRDLELALGERMDLSPLSEAGRPLLLLLPGRRRGRGVSAYATGPHDGLPLPPALTPEARTWSLGEERP